MSSGLLFTYFSIQQSLSLTSSPYSIPTLLFRLHFHEFRRASHLLQHPAVTGPDFRSPYSLLFVSGCSFMSSGVLLTYFNIKQTLSLISQNHSRLIHS
jgi:hypothetical protein